MKGTPLAVGVVVLATGAASAQPLARALPAAPPFEAVASGYASAANPSSAGIAWPAFGRVDHAAPPARAALASEAGAAVFAATRPWHAGIDFALRASTESISPLTLAAEARFWQLALQTQKRRAAHVDWLGLFAHQTRVDAIMHGVRLQQKKFHEPLYHSKFFPGYREAMKGYFSLPLRWDDGDDFVTNDINHPIMGATYSYIYTDYDRRCSNMVFNHGSYWSCLKRATLYASVASVNWEWNPLMSESSLGHIGKFRTCTNGRCSGEGGWTDVVMTPLGGLGIRIVSDLARAKLWPVLDRELSGNALAKVLNYAVKGLTAPSHVINCAFKLDFRNAWKPADPAASRRR